MPIRSHENLKCQLCTILYQNKTKDNLHRVYHFLEYANLYSVRKQCFEVHYVGIKQFKLISVVHNVLDLICIVHTITFTHNFWL